MSLNILVGHKLLFFNITILSSCSWCSVIKQAINQPLANTKRQWHSNAFCNAKHGWFARQILSGRIQFMQITTKCGHEGQCMAHSSACLSHSVVPGAVAGTYHVRYIPLLAQNISSKLPPPPYLHRSECCISNTLSFVHFVFAIVSQPPKRGGMLQSNAVPRGTPHNI